MAFTANDKEKRYELTPEEYEEARKFFSKSLKEFYKDKTNHPNYGKHLSEDRKQLISQVNKGNKYCLGRKLSDETKKKIGDANRNPSPETRKKMSDARKGKQTGSSNPKAKAIIRLSDKKIYGSIIEASKENSINYSTLRDRVHKGKDFMYYDLWLQQHKEEK